MNRHSHIGPIPMRALAAAAMLVAVAAVTYVGSAMGSSQSTTVTVSMTVPSSITLTNGCTQRPAWDLGQVLPGSSALTDIGANVCRFDFQSSNDTAQIRLGQQDREGTAMGVGPSNIDALFDAGGNNVVKMTIGASPNVAYACMYNGDGAYFKTIDSGANWTSHTIGSGKYCRFEFQAADDSLVYAFSDDDEVHITSNGGTNWNTYVPPGLTGNLLGTAERGTTKMWATQQGGNNLVRYTADGSATPPVWVNQTMATAPAVTDVLDIESARNGGALWAAVYACCWDSRVAVSTDDGTTWALTAAPLPRHASDIAAWDNLSAWTWNDSYTPDVIRTDDGGATWEPIDELPWDTGGIAEIVPVSATDVWAFANDGMVAISSDAGDTWSRIPTGVVENFESGDAISTTTAYTGGTNETRLATVDGGSTWDYQTSNESLRSITAADGQNAWAVGSEGRVVATADFGTTWAPQTSITNEALHGVSAADQSAVWAVGDAGTIIHTTDGGTSWSAQSSGVPSEYLQDVEAISATHAWAVGTNGTILHTANGGASWTQQTSGTTEILRTVEALNDQYAWVAGENGTVLITADGGATWNPPPTPLPVSDDIPDMALVNTNTAVLTTFNNGDTWVTEDGGTTWVDRGDGRTHSADAAPGTDIVFRASWYEVFGRSTNFADTWEAPTPSGWASYYDVAAVDANTAYALVQGGGLRKQSETVMIPDYASGVQDWTTPAAGGMFGVCIQDVGLAAVIDGPWVEDTVNSPNTCEADNLDPWSAIPALSSKVSHTNAAGATGRVDLVWGARVPATQQPGDYRATVLVEAIAPNI